jgi:uncharacterized protein
MGRIFFFLLLALAAYVAWQWLRRSASQGAAPRKDPAVAQAMVSCAHCGLHVPRTDALPSGERYYCSEEHRQRGPSA